MGSSASKPKKERYIIHIKKCTIRDNKIYLYDDNKMAKIVIEESIKHIPTNKIDHVSSEISF